VTSVAAPAAADNLEGLIRLAVEGDEAAFAQIVNRHHEDMVRVSYVVSGNYDIAEDATASAWHIAWKRLGSLREPERLRAWLCSVAANEARQIIRNRNRRTVREIAVAVPSSLSSGWSDPSARSDDIDLANALADLNADDRTLLALRYVAGLNSTELSRATGLSASGVRARLARLLERLRKELGDE
jgi:RNA polymerase sigma factor (sigma-70 family)